jgi:hypothetical protein
VTAIPDGAVVASPDAAPTAMVNDPNDPWIWGDEAVLRGLDKVTAETRDFRAKIGEEVAFLGLTPERQPEVIVGMEIFDRRSDGSGGEGQAARIYSGWMFGSSPGLNPLEHSVYDVWVLDCVDSRAAPPEAVAAPADAAPATEDAGEASVLPGEVFD